MENMCERERGFTGTYQIGDVIFKPLVVGAKINKLMMNNYKWTIYLKPYANENIEAFIGAVVFHYVNAKGGIRHDICYSKPYQITFIGHQNAEVNITIHLRNEGTTIYLQHFFRKEFSKLCSKPNKYPREYVVEQYAQIELERPSQQLYELLMRNELVCDDSWKHLTDLEPLRHYAMKRGGLKYDGRPMLSDPEMYFRFVN